MKKHLITLCAASGLAILTPAAFAGGEVTPEGYNGKLSISSESPGLNCTYGGIRIDVQRGKRDVMQEMGGKPRPAPKPDPADEVYFVCNGAPGIPGVAGPQGPSGATGPQGSPGVQTKRCITSVRESGRVNLPRQLRGKKMVRLVIQGPNTTNVRFNRKVKVRKTSNGRPFVSVPLRNRNCGSYVVSVRPLTGSAKPLTQIWTITGMFGLRRQQL